MTYNDLALMALFELNSQGINIAADSMIQDVVRKVALGKGIQDQFTISSAINAVRQAAGRRVKLF